MKKVKKKFDEGIKRTRLRQDYEKDDDTQRLRAYKTNVEQKSYENLVGEPEQSVLKAMQEAVSQ